MEQAESSEEGGIAQGPEVRVEQDVGTVKTGAKVVGVLQEYYGPVYQRTAPSLGGVPFQAPRHLAEFVGREAEIAQLAGVLEPGSKAAITGLIGMGGIGKTELAKVVADRVADRFRDGVLWADCGEQSLVTIASLWAAAYGIQLPGDEEAAQLAAWRSLISPKEALLIFDNVQRGQDIEPLFPPRGRSAVLLTTRYAHHPALQGAERLQLDQFTHKEAAALVDELLDPGTAQQQKADATRLFGLLGYLPLALNVALQLAKRCGWTLAALNRELEAAGALTVLGNEERLHKSLNATFEAAWQNLPTDLQETFRTLVLFNQGPSFSAAALADTMTLDETQASARLHRLAGQSLLSWKGKSRWSLHALLRGFAATRPPVDDSTRARMARHYARVASAANDLYLQGGEDTVRGLALFDLEWPHIRAGQAWATAHAADDEQAAQLASDYPGEAARCLSLRLHPEELIRWLEAAARAARQLGDKDAEGAHLGNLGTAYSYLGQVERAIEFYNQALVIAREVGDRLGEGNRLGNLGTAYHYLGQAERAIDFYAQALAIAREIGDRRGEGTWLGNLGNAYSDLGQVERAIEFYNQALAIARDIGDRRAEGNGLGNLGSAYRDLGQVERAIEYHEQALAIHREVGDRRGEGNDLSNLGISYRALGQVQRAIEFYNQALAIAREIGDRRGEGNDLGSLGTAYSDLGQTERAIDFYQQALAIRREIGDRRGEGNWLGNLGLAYYSLGRVKRAIDLYEQALAIAREIGDRRGEGNALGSLGSAYLGLGDTDQAREFLAQTLAIFEAIQEPRAELLRRVLAQLDE